MALTRTVDPTAWPVTDEAIREHCNVTDHDDDARLSEYIKAATRHIERLSRKQLITQTWRATGDNWPGDIIELPKRPLQSVTSVKYYDSSDVQQTASSGLYTVDTDATPGRIVLDYGESWPTNRGHKNDIEVTFVCGYGDAGSDVPDTLIHAMKMLISHWNELREATITGTIIAEVPMAVAALYHAERDYASPDQWWDN